MATLNVYDKISHSSGSKKSESQSSLRTRYYDFCNLKDNTAYCVLTGRNGRLKLAHLLPASADKKTLQMLKLTSDDNGRWSLSNVLLLSWNVELYFDQLNLEY